VKWWLSFADPKRPAGQQFLGVAVVEAPEFILACMTAKTYGCNPGGEVQGWPMPDLPPDAPEMKLPTNRLLSRADLEAAGIKLLSLAEAEAAAADA